MKSIVLLSMCIKYIFLAPTQSVELHNYYTL